MTRILYIIIKFIRKLSKMSLKSLFKLILDLISGKNILFSFLQIFKLLSFIFTLIYLINDSLAKNLIDIFNINIFDNLKIYWNKLLNLILKIINYFRFDESIDTPEPKMLIEKEDPKLYEEKIKDLLKINKDKDIKIIIIIQDKVGNTYDDNWSFYWKLIFILVININLNLVIIIIGN